MNLKSDARATRDAEVSAPCTGCHSPSPAPFFEVPSVPASVGVLPRTAEQASQARRGAVRLVACQTCGLIQNQLFDVDIVGFEPGYEVSLFHSPIFRAYIQSVCDRLIDRYQLRGKDILEIGCGGGDFLRLICRQGANRGVGIDPTIATASSEELSPGSVQFLPGYFSSQHHQHIGDFLCCLSVFEDIPQPLEFLQSLRRAIGSRPVPVYFEVFNGFRSILEKEVWSIHYEQCNYFSLESLTGLFRRAGFEVVDAGGCYQGAQYLYVEARPAPAGASDGEDSPPSAPPSLMPAVRTFEQEYRRRSQWWQQKLADCKAKGRAVVVWGSGGKGISFLTSLPDADIIEWVVDVNPDRQNHYIPLSGQRIVAPEQLRESVPNVVILTNPLYQDEISQQLAGLGIQAEMLVA